MSLSLRQPSSSYALGGTCLLLTGVLLPVAYLVIRALDADMQELAEVVFRTRNAILLANTVLLTLGVLAASCAIALPLAWITARGALAGKRWWALTGILPLAIPSYLMAYAFLAIGGQYGASAQAFGWVFPRITGYWGALLVLTLCNFPYLFFNLRASLLTLDTAVEEVAYSLGQSPSQVFVRVVLPQLRPALSAGMLLIGLHVLGDFGAVSLMRFETFSMALYLQYNAAYDRTYAAWLALMLLALTAAVLMAEFWFLRGLRFDRAGSALTSKPRIQVKNGNAPIAYAFVGTVLFTSVIAPVATMVYWASRTDARASLGGLASSLAGSVSASLPAAVATTILVIPIVYLSVRRPSWSTQLLERSTYLGYATPSFAFALGLIFFSLRLVPSLYQSMVLLIYAYTMHFMAEAVGPVRSALYQASPRLEEAAHSLGASWFTAFRRVTLPLLRNGLLVSMAFVFLSCMRELHLTILLSPLGFHSLALDVWDFVNNAMFAQAAPYALTIMGFSALFVAVLITKESQTS